MEHQNNMMSEPTTPRVFGRSVFWIAYALGSLALLFSWLLAQVPHPRRSADFTLDYTVWSCSAGLLLVCILVARRTWKVTNPITEAGPGVVTKVVLGAAWLELAFSLYGIISLATYR